MMRRIVLFTCVLALVLLTTASPAAATAPANDDFASAAVISNLPFTDTVDNTEATLEAGEPTWCGPTAQSVWYSITPAATEILRADTAGTLFTTDLAVFHANGTGLDGLSFVGCAFSGTIKWSAVAGETYYLQAASFYQGGGSLTVNVDVAPPPSNDDFVDATVVSSIPFSDDVDLSGATVEVGEPGPSCSSAPLQSAWYSFTPAESGSFIGGLSSPGGFGFSVEYGVYTGAELGGLTEVACHIGSPLVFHADAGTTYYVQVGVMTGTGHPVTFSLDPAPAPVAAFGFYPYDPSVFDTLQFYDWSFDPAQIGIDTADWDFGDGTTASGCCPSHRYGSDGDYTVALTVTTFDGRTASTTQTVAVRTHDVAITRLLCPVAASVGQTRPISVSVRNRRYPEQVEVQLFKSTVGGFQFVGASTQLVSVRPANRTTTFGFSYTFTSDDAALGKVSFRAVATIVGARDALPADNEAIAPPTRVM